MRVVFYLVLLVFVNLVEGQSYVDSGINKYHSKEYNEALIDFEKAYEIRQALPNTSIAKIFLYRALTRFEIYKMDGEKVEAEITLKSITEDVQNSLAYGNEWPSKVEELKVSLHKDAINYAEERAKKAKRENDFDMKMAFMEEQIEYLSIASSLKESSESTLGLGQVYKEIGDLYFERAEDLAILQKVKARYEKSLEYLELARYDDPYSKQIIEDLLDLSKKLDDQTRVEEYTKLLKLAGG